MFGAPPPTALVCNWFVEDAGDRLVEDAGDGLVEDAGDGLVDDAHPQYNEDELPLTNALLFAFTPPEGQLVAALA